MVRKVLYFSLFFLLLGGVAFAEDYKSNKTPSDEIIIKNLKTKFLDFQDKNYIGKAGSPEGGFVLYLRNYEGRIRPDSRLIKLDNNLWIFLDDLGRRYILQE